MQTINACQKGHRYKSSVLQSEQLTPCPRCDRLALVALAYGDCQRPPRGCRSLSIRTESICDPQELAEVVAQAGRYNRFNPARVLHEIRPIFSKLSGVEFGREGSPVLYGHVPYWTHQAIEWNGQGMGIRIDAHERRALSKAFLDAMGRAEADELTDTGYVLRAWWD